MPAVTSHYAFAHTVLPWFLLQDEVGCAERFELLHGAGGEQQLDTLYERGMRDWSATGNAPVETFERTRIVLRRETFSGLPALLIEFPSPRFPGESHHAAVIMRKMTEAQNSLARPALSYLALDHPPLSGDPILREAQRAGDGLVWRRRRIVTSNGIDLFRALVVEETGRLHEAIEHAAVQGDSGATAAPASALLRAVRGFLERSGYRYRLSGDGVAAHFGFVGEHVRWDQLVHCDDARDRILATASAEVDVPPERRAAVAETLARINAWATLGGFELDFNRGAVRYRVNLHVAGRPVTERMLQDLVDTPGQTLDNCWPAIRQVIAGELTSEEAFAKATHLAGAADAVPPAPRARADALRNRIIAWLDANRLNYWLDQPAGLLGLRFKGNNGHWTTMIDCREPAKQIVSLSTADLDIPARARTGVIELVSRLNDRLGFGHFDYDFDTGRVRARMGCRAEPGALTDALIDSVVYSGGNLLDRYLPTLRDVAEVGAAPALALARIDSQKG